MPNWTAAMATEVAANSLVAYGSERKIAGRLRGTVRTDRVTRLLLVELQ